MSALSSGFFLLLWVFFATPTVDLTWKGKSRKAIAVQAGPVVDDLLDRCGRAGLEVRYRFELQICASRSYWADNCGVQRAQVQTYQHDPIAEGYFVETDFLGDKAGPDRWLVDSREAAIAAVSRIEKLSLSNLGGNRTFRSGEYLAVRLTVDCRGERSGFFSDLTRLLSFGFADDVLVDTGWLSFPLSE